MLKTQFFFDVDSTVISGESLQDMVLHALEEEKDDSLRDTAKKELIAITNAGMNGEIDFEESLQRRLALARVEEKHMQRVTENMLTEITKGMHDFMEALRSEGHGTWLLTAGLMQMMLPLARELGINADHVLANEPMWTQERLTGFQPGPLLKTEGKATVLKNLRKEGRVTGNVIMIGDGASDLAAYELGGADDFFGYGEHAKRTNVVKRAPHFFSSVQEMKSFVL